MTSQLVKVRVEILENDDIILGNIWREENYHCCNKKVLDIIQRQFNISDDMMFYFKIHKKIKYTELTPSELIRVVNGIHSALGTNLIYGVRIYVDNKKVVLE